MFRPLSRLVPFELTVALVSLTGAARAQLSPEWIAKLPAGSSLTAGTQDIVVDPAGVSYVTGITGPSSNTDIVTAAFRADGSLLWSHVFNGVQSWHDQARGIALGPGGVVYVTGNTPGPGMYASVLLLAYEAATGALLNTVQYSSAPFTSEYGGSVVIDAQGGVYVGGGTVGDGGDGLLLKIDAAGQLLWQRTWDGPALAPYSQDQILQLQLDPSGDLIALIHGVMGSNQPDYVVVKYDPSDGSTLWETNWGVNGGDYPRDMEIDAAGDVFVTGTGIFFTDRFSTIKLRGADGQLLWQAYDSAGADDRAVAVALDGLGGVYVTGAADPDGNQSNFNDNIYTVKRDAADGSLSWKHLYGANCIGCYDVPSDVIVDPAGNAFVAGSTSSPPYSSDLITLVLHAGSGEEAQRGIISGSATQSFKSGTLRLDGSYGLFNGGETYDFNTGGVEIAVVKHAALVPGPLVYCTAKLNSCGTLPAIGCSGSPSATAGNGFTVTATNAKARKLGLLLYTDGGPRVPPTPFQGGLLCIGSPILRSAPLADTTGTPGLCDGRLSLDMNCFASESCGGNPAAFLRVPGTKIDCQLFARDTVANGSLLSDALEYFVGP